MKTLSDIYNRRDLIVRLNKKHNYTSLKLEELKKNGNPSIISSIVKKRKQYHRLLLELRQAEAQVIKERRKDKRYSDNLKIATKNIVSVLNNPLTIRRTLNIAR